MNTNTLITYCLDETMLLPKKIKTIRQKLGLTQSQFAAFMGLSSSRRIREWESGDKHPNGTACIVLEYCFQHLQTDPFIQSRLQAILKK